ncbi:DUF2946 family protein [Pseudomonas sp. OIL-1]|uniref:DUF2946 family protein n=1 Tax=Pseudomonas sp. OIL-1 TaxID=2706126 RepID=UPI00353203FA
MSNRTASRGTRAWLAVLFGWCVIFNAVICCVHSSHVVAVALDSDSLESCVEHDDDMPGMASSMPDQSGANLAASLGCPLCSSAGGIALSSYWPPVLVPLEQSFASSVTLTLPLTITEHAPSQPRAPPAVS